MVRHCYLRRMASLAVGLVAVGTVAAACGGSGQSTGPLPPIISTTTTTTELITTTTAPASYEIQKGDTLAKIAKRFGISTRELKIANGITNANHIEVGQTLIIPRPGEIKLPNITTTLADTTTLVAGASTTFVP